MGIGATEDFDAEELAMLEALRNDERQAAAPAAAAPAAAPAVPDQPSAQPGATETQPPATTSEPAAAAQAQPSTEQQPQGGDPRAALRAARRAERQAREQADKLRAELEELRKQVPQQQPASVDGITDAELAELEQDFPAQAKLVRANRELQKQLAQMQSTQAQQPAQAAQPEFEPPALPPELQDVVDSIPALLDWQCNPDQTAFEMAKATDAALMHHPVWKTKPLAERFAEVTRRVQAELGAAATSQPSQQQQPAAAPAQVLATVPRQAPSTLSDIGAGATAAGNPLTLERMARMSDEDILAELARQG